jgi:hypothetical protein
MLALIKIMILPFKRSKASMANDSSAYHLGETLLVFKHHSVRSANTNAEHSR